MNTSETNIEVQKVWFTETGIFIETISSLKLSHPLTWFPKLDNASKKELMDFELSPFGIHWPSLDEDLSFRGFSNFKK